MIYHYLLGANIKLNPFYKPKSYTSWSQIPNYIQKLSSNSWLLIQLQSLESDFNGSERFRWARLTSFRSSISSKAILSSPYKWQQWNSLVFILAGLAKNRVSVIGLVSNKLLMWALALGWSTWLGSKLDWLLVQHSVNSKDLSKLNIVVRDSCFLVTESTWTKVLSTTANIEHIPTLGISQPIRDSRGLWYSLSLESQGLFQGEFILWSLLWIFLKTYRN